MEVFKNCVTNKDQGNIGLAKAIFELQMLGYRLSVPITENQKYDLIGDKDGILNKIQIKTTRHKTKYGFYKVGLRTLGGNQSFHTIKKRVKGDYDLLYVLSDDGTSYLIPDEDFDNLNSITLGIEMNKYRIEL